MPLPDLCVEFHGIAEMCFHSSNGFNFIAFLERLENPSVFFE